MLPIDIAGGDVVDHVVGDESCVPSTEAKSTFRVAEGQAEVAGNAGMDRAVDLDDAVRSVSPVPLNSLAGLPPVSDRMLFARAVVQL